MLLDGLADCHRLAVVRDSECTVILGQPLVEPERRAAKVVSDEQVYVFMKGQRVRAPLVLLVRRERDVVHILPGLKIARHVRRRLLRERLEWPVGLVVPEDDDDERYGRAETAFGQQL